MGPKFSRVVSPSGIPGHRHKMPSRRPMDVANAPVGINVPRGRNVGGHQRAPRQASAPGRCAGSRLRIRAVTDFGPAARITGIDISPSQLERNKSLDVSITGDLQSHPLSNEAFDEVVCWNVLEHVPLTSRGAGQHAASSSGERRSRVGRAECPLDQGLGDPRDAPCIPRLGVSESLRIASAGSDDHGPFPSYFADPISPEGLRNTHATKALTFCSGRCTRITGSN